MHTSVFSRDALADAVSVRRFEMLLEATKNKATLHKISVDLIFPTLL